MIEIKGEILPINIVMLFALGINALLRIVNFHTTKFNNFIIRAGTKANFVNAIQTMSKTVNTNNFAPLLILKMRL